MLWAGTDDGNLQVSRDNGATFTEVGKNITGLPAGALSGDAPTNSHAMLSNRELEVLGHIASGKTIKEISSLLALSEKTVATYRSRIAAKMGLSSNVELTRYAMRHGLVD